MSRHSSLTPAPSPLAKAVCQGLTGRAPSSGFTLMEIILVIGGLSLLGAGSFMIYQHASNNAKVKAEQDNVQTLAANADRVYGALGSYQNVTTERTVTDRVPPSSMVVGTGLMSRWLQPVVVEPTDAGGQLPLNSGLKITYQAVPARACAKFAQAASEGMFDVEVDGRSVLSSGHFDTESAIIRCAEGATSPVAFTYHGGSTGLAGTVLEPVRLPPLNPPTTPPPPPPPVTPPPPPAPGCGAAPAPATGTTPPGQVCSFSWISAPAPTCWAVLPVCTPIAPPPSTPPPVTPPSTPPQVTPPPPGSPAVCSPPASFTETDNQTANCNAGRVTPAGASTFTQTRTRTVSFSCPDPFDAPVRTNGEWTAWIPTEGAACALACEAPPTLNESRTVTETAPAAGPFSRTLECPAGESGTWTQSRTAPPVTRTATQTRTTTYSCPAPTGPYTANVGAWSDNKAPYGAWSSPSYSPWTDTTKTCAPKTCGTWRLRGRSDPPSWNRNTGEHISFFDGVSGCTAGYGCGGNSRNAYNHDPAEQAAFYACKSMWENSGDPKGPDAYTVLEQYTDLASPCETAREEWIGPATCP